MPKLHVCCVAGAGSRSSRHSKAGWQRKDSHRNGGDGHLHTTLLISFTHTFALSPSAPQKSGTPFTTTNSQMRASLQLTVLFQPLQERLSVQTKALSTMGRQHTEQVAQLEVVDCVVWCAKINVVEICMHKIWLHGSKYRFVSTSVTPV